MSEKELSKQESLDLITDMINQAKSNFQRGGSFYFLFWGWVIMLANFSHYYLAKFTNYEMPHIVWLIAIPAGIVSGVYSFSQRRKATVKSHLDRMYGHVWTMVGIGILITLIFMSRLGYNHSAVIMLLAGIGTYISGRMLKFMPLVLGGLALIIAGVICFNVPIVEQYLVSGLGILAGYLVPGYLLKSKEK